MTRLLKIKSWRVVLIALIALLSNTYSIAQNKPYCFTDLEIKEIAYQLKSRSILIADTVTYRSTIANLNKALLNTKKIVSNQSIVLINKAEYINYLESDIQKLQMYSEEVEYNNSVLSKKLKIYKHALPISLIGGGVAGLLIFKR